MTKTVWQRRDISESEWRALAEVTFGMAMSSDASVTYRHQSVLPDMPPPSAYLPLLEEMHARRWYSNFGPLSRRLEAGLLLEFGLEGETCVAACNATAGLSAALMACGKAGPVLTPAFTFPATLGAIRAASMTPIVVDVTPDDWTLGPEQLDHALRITSAKIVMLVAPFGIKRAFSEHQEICRRRNVALVIDSAAGLGVPRPVRRPSEDVFEVFSMHATKPFGVGEGGAIFGPSSKESALRAALGFALTTYNQPSGPEWGFNGKMSELHAAVGLVQLERFRHMIRSRQTFVGGYLSRLSGCHGLGLPRNVMDAPWQFFPVLTPNEAVAMQFIQNARARGVEIRRYYRPSLSRWPGIEPLMACPVAEDLARRMCVMPVRSSALAADIDEIVGPTAEALQQALLQHDPNWGADSR